MKHLFIIVLSALVLTTSCNSKRTAPKPRGYYRIELPQDRKYARTALKGYPYSFEVSQYTKVAPTTDEHSEPYWVNIDYPGLNAKIHVSYKRVNSNLDKYIEDTHFLVYKHTVKSDGIIWERFENNELHTFGYIYEIGGNAASNVQFYLTDSSRHFLRGSLYFNTHPNRDSLQPVIQYITEDIWRLMESTEWK